MQEEGMVGMLFPLSILVLISMSITPPPPEIHNFALNFLFLLLHPIFVKPAHLSQEHHIIDYQSINLLPTSE